MTLYYNKRANASKVIADIRKKPDIAISEYALERIEQILDDYTIYIRERKKPKTNLFWRCSAPLYGVAALLVFCLVSPIKWLFTGKFYWRTEGMLVQFFESWKERF